MNSQAVNPQLLRFVLTAGALYLLWFFGYEQWLKPAGHLDETLSFNIAATSAAVLRTFGLAAAATQRLVLVAGKPAVSVGDPCNGLVLYALFAGFLLAFPGGSWAHKLTFIAVGLGLIYALNILRVGLLAINHFYWRETVDFNHHYTFSFVVYGCICLLWLLWIRRYASPSVPDYPLVRTRYTAVRRIIAALLVVLLFLVGTHDEAVFAHLTALWQRIFAGLGILELIQRVQHGTSTQITTRSLPAMLSYGLLYTGVCLFVVWLLVPPRTWRTALGLYGLVFGSSILLLLVGKLAGDAVWAYRLGRHLIDFIVSPLPVVMLVPLLHWQYASNYGPVRSGENSAI